MDAINIKRYAGWFDGYTELRHQENRNTRITFVKGNNVGNSRSVTSGISARVYKNGSWGFASSPDTTDENIKAVVKAAADGAVFLDSKTNKGKGPLPVSAASSDDIFSTRKPKLRQKELLTFVKDIDRHIASSYPDLSSRRVILNCLDMEKYMTNSEGSYFHSMIPRAHIYVFMTLEKDGDPIEIYDVFGGLGQFEDVFTDPSDIFEDIAAQYEHLKRKSEGIYADAGTKVCVMDGDLSGILAHEAIGHTTEADLVMGGSIVAGKIGREVASPLITLVDYANVALGETCPVPVYIDDEGTKAEDAVIIDKGVLKSYMHNKESAAYFGAEPTGNARAFSFSDEPLIRMRNTAFLPGPDKVEDMIASVEDGYYLMRTNNGQADSTSEFMFGVTLGYEIKNGKVGRAIRDTTISGVAFDVLKTVDMVSDEVKWSNSGMCGKKQPIPVGSGGPAIKCRLNIGGR